MYVGSHGLLLLCYDREVPRARTGGAGGGMTHECRNMESILLSAAVTVLCSMPYNQTKSFIYRIIIEDY